LTIRIATAISVVVLHERLAALRKLADLSNAELDRLSGLRKGHSRALELNPDANPELRTLKALAATLGTSIGYLANGEEPGPTAAGVVLAVDAARARLVEAAPKTGTDEA
jgi:transcriptional regulator with XRE-family HTH domain